MYRGISVWNLLLLVQLAQFSDVTQGKTVVLGIAGNSAELSCKASQQKNMPFSWKFADNTKILESQSRNTFLAKAQSDISDRVDSKKIEWDKGSFPLVISKLEMKDSKTYICEVENKKTEVELQVFKATVHPNNRLLQGQSLTLTLEGPGNVKPSVKCKSPRNKNFQEIKTFSVASLETGDSGIWMCTLTADQNNLQFEIRIMVQGFREASTTKYQEEGKPVEFSFPAILEDEKLSGEIKWQAEKPPSTQSLATFSVENKKVSVQTSSRDPKVELEDTLPLRLKLPQALLQYAGSGNLTLTLAQGKLHHLVNLVVVRVRQSQDTLLCEVLGPTSPKMKLTLMLENQKDRVSKQEKMVQVPNPEMGVWHCLLSEGNTIWVDSKLQVSSRALNQHQPMFLAAVLGSVFGFLALCGLCIVCCVRCRDKRRQAERTSQIKRLLSEKKTCQCPHRLQKTQNLI